jgi:hypothetical protein
MTLLKKELARQQGKPESYLDRLSGIGIVLLDSALNIMDCNHGFMKTFQLRKKPIGSPVADFLILGDNNLKHSEELKLCCSRKSGIGGILYCHATDTRSGHLIFCERHILTESRTIEQIGLINNELINLQREYVKKNLLLEKLRQELDERIAELEAALARVKQLEGIITICMYCKRIQDDQENWQKLEKYITEHSEAQFSHGICPTCFEREIEKEEN